MERVSGAAFTYIGHHELTEEEKKEADEQVKRMLAIAKRQMLTGKVF